MAERDGVMERLVMNGGIRHPHYFNGRLLAAEDLGEEQKATERHLAMLGRAVGDGVAFGFDVAKSEGLTLTVTPGLAVNRQGTSLELVLPKDEQKLELTFGVTAAGGAATANDSFPSCDSGTTASTGTAADGVYMLVVGPYAAYTQDRVPLNGMSATDGLKTYGQRYLQEGLSFRLLLWLKPWTWSGEEASLLELWAMNELAHLCLGSASLSEGSLAQVLKQAPRLGTEPPDREGEVSPAAVKGLGVADMPLALVLIQDGAIADVDMWAVRRPLASGSPLLGARRTLGEAVFRQYVDKVMSQVPKMKYFRTPYLPAAGYLPAGAAPSTYLGAEMRYWPLPSEQTFDLLERSLTEPPIRRGTGNEVIGYTEVTDGYFFWRLDRSLLGPRAEVVGAWCELKNDNGAGMNLAIVAGYPENFKLKLLDQETLASLVQQTEHLNFKGEVQVINSGGPGKWICKAALGLVQNGRYREVIPIKLSYGGVGPAEEGIVMQAPAPGAMIKIGAEFVVYGAELDLLVKSYQDIQFRLTLVRPENESAWDLDLRRES